MVRLIVHGGILCASAQTKEFFVSRTGRSASGKVSEALVRGVCANQKQFQQLQAQLGNIIDGSGTIVTSYTDVINGTSYGTLLDPTALQTTVTNLVGNRESISRTVELQAAMALKEALLARDDVESVGGVVDHISMHNPCIQRSAVYPDLYAWGLLKDGRPFEAVGDSKFKASGSVHKHMRNIQKYMHMLNTPGTAVVGDFESTRVPTPVIFGVLASYVIDQQVIDATRAAGIILLAPSGLVLMNADLPSGVSLISGAAGKKLRHLNEDDVLGEDESDEDAAEEGGDVE